MSAEQVKNHAESYNDRLRRCLAVIEGGFIGYPALQKLIHTRRYKAMLEALIHDCLETPDREWKPYHKDTEHIFISSRYLAKIHGDITHSYTIWVDAIRLFACIGLLWVKHPTKKTANTDREREAVARAASAQETGEIRHAITFIWLEEYTPQQLEKAAQQAEKWVKWRCKARLSNADVITLYGKATANRVFGDGRTISKPRQAVLEKMRDVLEGLFQKAPYTTQKAFFKAYGQGAKTAWKNNSRIIIEEMALEYRQQTKQDRIQFRIPPREKGWIIIRK